ncbi:6-phosphogluconolactonase [Solidesulfovibrio carbinoliphilus subsp. oakridgensis]|uniref:6-phosphogluconolactonase n=1 Tax=Solidesulfovibrio carbinoliphilus subsp. oakridgensis TaxID=694327 RepID=G7QA38_9BACT|nr:6-phosphogluconolactonase [Solidesulfovibrio carbinoliphilus]EHJ47868.1 6-phosphogluconolactonase [Solidesulfovibrio carbinoliphilus subsp. oakridgensis]
MTPAIRRFPDLPALTEAALAAVARIAREAVAARGVFTIALSGGSTPMPLYAAMAGRGFGAPFASTVFFFGDERVVPVGDRRSNFGAIAPVLFTPSPIPVGNIHPMPVEVRPLELAAATYEDEVREVLGGGADVSGALPRLDLVLLGMGPDGHTASLFPDRPALGETRRLVVAMEPPTTVEPRVARLTFTLPLLNAARNVLFLVGAKGKEEPLAAALHGPPDPHVPASLVRPTDGGLEWLIGEG